MLKDFLENASLKAKLIALSIPTFFLLVIIISIIAIANSSSRPKISTPITITNFSDELKGINQEYKEYIEYQIWLTVKDKNINESQNIEAKIRPNSVSTSDNTNYSLLIDIDSLHYSFHISFSYNTNSSIQPSHENYNIECPSKDEIIYTDKKCPIGTPIDQIQPYLPIVISIPATSIYGELRTYSDFQTFAGEKYLAFTANTCNDKNTVESVKDAINTWFKNHALDYNDYHIEILNKCYNAIPETGN